MRKLRLFSPQSLWLSLAFGLSFGPAPEAWAQFSCTPLNQPGLMALFGDNAPASSITPANIRSIICSMMGGPAATPTPNWTSGHVPVFGNSGLAGNTTGPYLIDSGVNIAQAFAVPVPLDLVDNKTGPIAATGATITGDTSGAVSADLIESYVFCTGPMPIANCGGGNYDALRGIAISNPGTTLPVISAVSGYVLSEQAFTGPGPSAVALFGTGAVMVDGASIWGMNTNVSDAQYRIAQSPGTHHRRVTSAEFDATANYPDTNLAAILIAGNSTVQPSSSTAVAVVAQDFSAPVPGSIAKWVQAYYTYPGVATHFANIGQTTSSTVRSDSQDLLFNSFVGSAGFQGEFYFGLAGGIGGGPNFGSTTIPTFNTNYGLQVMTGGITSRSTTDQIVQLGGKIDLSAGGSIYSRTDAGVVQPLEILAGDILLNSNTLHVNNGSGITAGVNCSGTPTSGFVSINGIVTHC